MLNFLFLSLLALAAEPPVNPYLADSPWPMGCRSRLKTRLTPLLTLPRSPARKSSRSVPRSRRCYRTTTNSVGRSSVPPKPPVKIRGGFPWPVNIVG